MEHPIQILGDGELIPLIREGSISAFEELYRRHWPAMYNTAFKRLKNAEQTKDVLQDIFTDLWVRREKISINNAGAFLHTAVRYQVYKLIAKREVSPEFFLLLDKIAISPYTADKKLTETEFSKLAESWMASLPEKRQMIFRMHYQDNLSTREIAEKLQISQKTVQNQLGKTFNDLRARLAHLFTLFISLVIFIYRP